MLDKDETEQKQILRNQILIYHISSIMTDAERAKLLDLPEGCRIRENAKIISPENLKCGKYVWIGEGAILDASGKLEIGDYTQIGLYVMIWTHSSYKQALRSETNITSQAIERKSTKIGSNVFIAGHSVIYSGVTIGDKVVILPMTVITKDIPSGHVVAGSPAKIIRELNEEDYIIEESDA